MKTRRIRTLILNVLSFCIVLACLAGIWILNRPHHDQHYTFDVTQIPEYSGNAYVVVNDGVPFFTDEDFADEPYEFYSELDELGRCQYAMALIDREMMPVEERADTLEIRPTGYHNAVYEDLIEDRYLYNRCHLIAYELTGENDNEKNLITGTRYMNTEGMLPMENSAASYIRMTQQRVLYRVTPVFSGDNLVADGVLMEAESEDGGLMFCVYCYNVQPGVRIDYATGYSSRQ